MPESRLPYFPGSPTKPPVYDAARPLLRLLALFWLALGMSVPVSAWTVHEAAHGVAQVSVDAHHHHDDDGGISVHEHEDSEAPDGGHDHMPSILLGAADLTGTAILPAPHAPVRAMFAIASSLGVELHTPDELRRPPRLG